MTMGEDYALPFAYSSNEAESVNLRFQGLQENGMPFANVQP
jgi:hypothetical protein